MGDRLPNTEASQMEDLLEMLTEAPFNGRADLPQRGEKPFLRRLEEFMKKEEAERVLNVAIK